MAKRSAGLVLYRNAGASIEILLVHPGGPFWAKRDEGAWSIPKGEVDEDGERASAAREFAEELGHPAPTADWIDLGEVVQSGGKRVHAWAAQGDLDVEDVTSNTFEMEWPPRSGRQKSFPEVDRAEWFGPEAAARKLVSGQAALIDRLLGRLHTS
jgi:predicted NUDIX family NTP pyrophosphohydrolase